MLKTLEKPYRFIAANHSMGFAFFIFLLMGSLFTTNVGAVKKKPGQTKPTDPISEGIDMAQTLVLQKKRIEAYEVLLRLLEKEKAKESYKLDKNTSLLLKSLNELSEVFISDKAQQLYENGRTTQKTNPSASQQIFLEALKLESGNVKIIFELVMLYLKSGECVKAQELLIPVGSARELLKIKSIERLGLLYGAVLLCQNKGSDFEVIRNDHVSMGEPGELIWLSLGIERAFMLKDLFLARTQLVNLQKKDPYFVTGYYWDWKINHLHSAGEKYLSECQNLSIKTQSKYDLDPQLCRYVTEVENEINKK